MEADKNAQHTADSGDEIDWLHLEEFPSPLRRNRPAPARQPVIP